MAEHAARIAECEERESVYLTEKDKAIKLVQEEMMEKLQTVIRRHNNELKLIKETNELEMEAWKNNYKKQQVVQLAEKETAIKMQCRKERDKEIEEVIERLEMEATEMKRQMEEMAENRVRRLKEKFDSEMCDLEKSERNAKNKYLEVKNKLLESEEVVVGLKAAVKQLQTQLEETRNVADKLTNDKMEMKQLVRQELKIEVAAVEKELNDLKLNRDKELQLVHARFVWFFVVFVKTKNFCRVKVAIARKDEMLEEMTNNQRALQEKCNYLENMLEQQRKEFLMK